MSLRSLLVTSSLLWVSTLWAANNCPLKDGDLIFIKSQSEQARLLKLSTKSEWTHVGMAFKRKQGWEVLEAIQPVKWTSLYSFTKRSRQLHFEVKRPRFDFDSKKVMSVAEENLGMGYDLIFAWDDERWYCTELIWKAYKKVTGEELGQLEQIGDLEVNHPAILAEAKRRFNQYGMKFDLEDWKSSPVITPVQMMNSPLLETISTHRTGGQEIIDCLTNR